MAGVRFEQVTKWYSESAPVIKDLNLEVRDAEFLVLVGPSGCGKSTALRMIAGLEDISEGDLYIGDRRVNDIAPKDRDVSMVFQNYALYPHMTVFDNMAFALKLRHAPRAEIEGRVQRAAQMLALGDYLSRKPRQLSGGQRQRVALGRALVRDPQVFLLDEPLSNLDAKLRVQTRAEISRLHQATGTTFVYVTHDQVEAMTMGDRIAVFNAGVVQQLGAPRDLYERPANLFVAGFIGSPAMNLFRARLVRREGGVAAVIGDGDGAATWALRGPSASALAGHAASEGRDVIVGVRPEGLRLADAAAQDAISGVVDVVEHLGNEQYVYLRLPGAVATDAEETQTSVARLPAEAKVAVGERLRLSVDTDALHVFDPTTTRRLD
ncbi:MAG TPA: sn-glycerol-3-phosphate ABC transporter ATP-binding protein UgpC [Ktedonobacterales bacterium]|nr:sn-glycerol-3-phosphate ABC transporter ATP-binding protein UgpC [Ktedonobacterales bacterium]